MMPSNAAVWEAVEDAVHYEIQSYDTDQALRTKDYNEVHRIISKEAFDRLLEEMRPEPSDEDYAFIQSRVRDLAQGYLDSPKENRFRRFDRVVCRIGGERGWGAGTIQALDEVDPADPTGQKKLPYVVKLDPPVGRLISVPYDDNQICRAEVCFGQMHQEDLFFSLRCKPLRKETVRRFAVGDRVAVAVEAPDGDYTVWAAGSVTDVNYDVQADATAHSLRWDWTDGSGTLPYRVLLDSGMHVYVHRDAHWLLRDLDLQPPGPRQAEDGTRDLTRLVKRKRQATGAGTGDVELIDHETRKVRLQAADQEDDSSDDSL